MAVALGSIICILLVAAIGRCANIGYNVGNERNSQFGELLKPPPPPISKILPVPFHGGVGLQRQNLNNVYNYQPPPPTLNSQFNFPSPFYKEYNFNFVPQPQPFSTTPSPSLFQKVSGWLFPSVQTSYENSLATDNNQVPNKKDCNPCNLVPWVPLIRYNNNIGAKNVQYDLPTYGPPSPTALNNFQNVVQYKPQPFQSPNTGAPSHLSSGVPHNTYGTPPETSNIQSSLGDNSISSSTYGPPSPTHPVEVTSQSPLKSNIQSLSYGLPSLTYTSSSGYSQSPSSFNHGIVSNSYNLASSTYFPSSSSYNSPSPSFVSSTPSSEYGAVPPQFSPDSINDNDMTIQNDVEVFNRIESLTQQQLPKTSPPTGFRNSYGEPITNTNIFDIPSFYSPTADVSASSKVRMKVLPDNVSKFRYPNVSMTLANPAPFTMNKGRNIHTLQPVALPNLSVSPLPPIFNARPFKPVESSLIKNILLGNSQKGSNIDFQIQESIQLAEYTQSVDYPATFVQSPVIDIDAPKVANQTKAYRNIQNGYIIDEIKDISSQASEDHISATKSDTDASFESTGTGVGNDLYESGIPVDMKIDTPSDKKTNFADLRDMNDEDIDKYRTDSNLQEIDSPLLYLRPSAPHKSHGNFVLAISTPINNHEYEIYDDEPSTTTTTASISTSASGWEESRNDIEQRLPPPVIQEYVSQPKLVQIIVPYTRSNQNLDNIETAQTISQDWSIKQTDEYQPRKVPPITEESHVSTTTESYNMFSVSTLAPVATTTTRYETENNNSPYGFSDLFDSKDVPFDIIKLQHTIDEWTQQEYSKQFETPQKTRNVEKYAKQIPDDFFTTTVPSNVGTDNNDYKYDFYDHEVSSSIQHSVRDENINATNALKKVYNTIDRSKDKDKIDDVKELEINSKFKVYAAASSFRTAPSTITSTTTSTSTTTTTPAPWDKIQVSISPLTKEKVYVVTSKPWREPENVTNEWYAVESPDTKKYDSDSSLNDNLPFKSPRFINRPSFGFTSGDKVEVSKTESPYNSKSWYQSINDLEKKPQFNITMLAESSQHNTSTNSEENTNMTTAEAPENSDSDI